MTIAVDWNVKPQTKQNTQSEYRDLRSNDHDPACRHCDECEILDLLKMCTVQENKSNFYPFKTQNKPPLNGYFGKQ